MKKLLLFCLLGLPGVLAAQQAKSKDSLLAEIRKSAAKMEALYKSSYQPPAYSGKKQVKSVKVEAGYLVIEYAPAGKERFALSRIEPVVQVTSGNTNLPRQVKDKTTGKVIFDWLQRETDAGVLRYDLKALAAAVKGMK